MSDVQAEGLTDEERAVLQRVDYTLRLDKMNPQVGTVRVEAGDWTTVEGYVERIVARLAQVEAER